MGISYCSNATAYEIFRGINKADKKSYTNSQQDTSVMTYANEVAQDKDNKTGITVALEDFADKTTGFHGLNNSCIVEDNTKKGFFQKVKEFFGGAKSDNVFEGEAAQNVTKDGGKITQGSLYGQEVLLSGGVKYAKEGDSYSESALNFAKADIAAIEKAYSMANPDMSDNNGKLIIGEVGSYTSNMDDLRYSFENIDLDGKKNKITAEEYASYLMVADGTIMLNNKPVFSENLIDGVISEENALGAKEYKDEDFAGYAKSIYDKYYN